MLQVLYINVVTKVDQDIAYVVMTIHICFKYVFQIFYLFQTMLQVFCLDVTTGDLDVVYTFML
jgi:hypothetical protein